MIYQDRNIQTVAPLTEGDKKLYRTSVTCGEGDKNDVKCLKSVQSRRKERITSVKWWLASDIVCLLFLCHLSDVTGAPLPLPSLQPPWLHTLQSWRCRTQRRWSHPDSFQEQDVVERFKWVSVQYP